MNVPSRTSGYAICSWKPGLIQFLWPPGSRYRTSYLKRSSSKTNRPATSRIIVCSSIQSSSRAQRSCDVVRSKMIVEAAVGVVSGQVLGVPSLACKRAPIRRSIILDILYVIVSFRLVGPARPCFVPSAIGIEMRRCVEGDLVVNLHVYNLEPEHGTR